MSYKNLEIWQLARDLVVDIHKITLHKLPSFEMYEEGRQIRKSIKSVKSTIIEHPASSIQYLAAYRLVTTSSPKYIHAKFTKGAIP